MSREEGKLTERAIRKIKRGLKDIKENKVISLEDYAKNLLKCISKSK